MFTSRAVLLPALFALALLSACGSTTTTTTGAASTSSRITSGAGGNSANTGSGGTTSASTGFSTSTTGFTTSSTASSSSTGTTSTTGFTTSTSTSTTSTSTSTTATSSTGGTTGSLECAPCTSNAQCGPGGYCVQTSSTSPRNCTIPCNAGNTCTDPGSTCFALGQGGTAPYGCYPTSLTCPTSTTGTTGTTTTGTSGTGQACAAPASGANTPIGCRNGFGCVAVASAPAHALFGPSYAVTPTSGAAFEAENSSLITPNGHYVNSVISQSRTQSGMAIAASASASGPWVQTLVQPSASAYSSDPVLAVDDLGRVYLTFVGFDDCNGQPCRLKAYIATSDDDGNTWTPSRDISDPAHPPADKPWIAVGRNAADGGPVVYASYSADFNASDDERVLASFNRGATFRPSTAALVVPTGSFANLMEISTDPSSSALYATMPVLASSSNPNGDRATDIYFSRSLDNGQSWSSTNVTNGQDPVVYNDPTVSGSGQNIFVTYVAGNPTSGAWNVYTRVSNNGGASFGPAIQVNDDAACATHLNAMNRLDDRGNLHVAWLDNRTGGGAAYYARLPAGASAFEPNIQVSDAIWPNFQDDHNAAGLLWLGDYESLYIRGNQAYVTWADPRSGSSFTYGATATLP